MVEATTNLPVRSDTKAGVAQPAAWRPLEDLRQEINRAFESFGRTDWLSPFRGLDLEPTLKATFGLSVPAVDLLEKDAAFELTAELPGMSPHDVDVSVRNGAVVIKGEKRDEKRQEAKGYYMQERRYGSFERSFAIPAGVDRSAIEATFNSGVLKVTLPKTLEAQKPAEKIEVKAA